MRIKWLDKLRGIEIVELYVYGNGIYAPPFWTRVGDKIQAIREKYEIVSIVRVKFIPEHIAYVDQYGEHWRGDELIVKLRCRKKKEE